MAGPPMTPESPTGVAASHSLHRLVGRSVIPVASQRLTIRIESELECDRQEERGNGIANRSANASIFWKAQAACRPTPP